MLVIAQRRRTKEAYGVRKKEKLYKTHIIQLDIQSDTKACPPSLWSRTFAEGRGFPPVCSITSRNPRKQGGKKDLSTFSLSSSVSPAETQCKRSRLAAWAWLRSVLRIRKISVFDVPCYAVSRD